ncbi:Ribonuclease H [Trema orientale]|uniref:Ribonuclease H n=1 Tax=Trema orientale TaxID=63057 RepID=A0A2P5DRS6_TREOI|nr:Ribonuclease H [Trema orientale]
MEEESNAFYLLRKGDIIGIYKSLSDCQAQVGSSMFDPSISVHKGYNLPKEAEAFLISHGIRNASYSISVNDVKDNLNGKLGKLVACPYQQPASFEEEADEKDSSPERWQEAIELLEIAEKVGCSSLPTISQSKHFKSDSSMTSMETLKVSSSCDSCSLEFDGASKGNPGPAGAGAVLRAEDGSVVWQLREGVGIATNNVAEYRAVLLGLKQALKKGFKHIRVQGDSKLVCMQEFNSEADVQANQAIHLKDGEVQEDCKKM